MAVENSTTNNNMHPLSTHHSTSFSTTAQHGRTDDDITAAVTSFLHGEGAKLHSETWEDATADVTNWLADQIQKEREGWRQKTRAAMIQIENHRKEVLRYQTVIQECTDQLKIVAECCNTDEETLTQIAEYEPRQALPLYIASLTETLNSLMEDRITSLQILHADDHTSKASLPSLLKTYIETLKTHAEKNHKDAKNRLESLESANKHSNTEIQKMRKTIHRKQEEVEKLHNKLEEIKDLTVRKFKTEAKDSKDFDDQCSQTDVEIPEPSKSGGGRKIGTGTEAGGAGRSSPPSSLYSAPTPVPIIDQRNIQISAERLSKLRRSAKKLENSLNDALTQMDSFRKGIKPTKVTQSNLFGTPRPLGMGVGHMGHMPEVPAALKKEMKLLPSPMWSTKFEISGPKIHDAELEGLKQQERDKEERKRRAKERRREAIQKSQDRTLADPPTFRSLMKSLDEVKKTKNKTFKPVGHVTKCLRCNKLFTLNDNHKKACNYHPKGKERIEQYSDRGKLVKVTYVWKCCMMAPDTAGCMYGQHI